MFIKKSKRLHLIDFIAKMYLRGTTVEKLFKTFTW